MSVSPVGKEHSTPAFCFTLIVLLGLSYLASVPLATAGAAVPASSPPLAQQASMSSAPLALQGYKPTGSLPSSAVVDVEVGIPLRNLPALQSLVQQISTPGSAMFDHFLTQTQIAQDFLPTAQYDQAISYLRDHGFTIVTSALDSSIVATGTVSQIANSLGLHYELYSNGTSSYYAAFGSSVLPGDYVYSSNVTAIYLSRPPTLVNAGPVSSSSSSPASSPSARLSPSLANQSSPIEVFPMRDLQTVYNVTGLSGKGLDGAGYTAGVLDFDGDPYISQALQSYDEDFAYPAPPHFSVIGLQPYNPGLGTATGWDVEISLDVEAVHSMAPGASIDLYLGNNALPLGPVLAPIVQQDKVNDLSQSFGIPEQYYSTPYVYGGLEFNVILPDQYYMLGSAEGISFLSASSDAGGSGDSGGPVGTSNYPSSSPYVTSVGGTTTYLELSGQQQVVSSVQTAWSAYGYVPYHANNGGSTGGVSNLEPLPWYQSGLTVPSSFPNGRMTPDLALDASIYPGVFAVATGNVTYIIGGTSESSPLLAGLLTVLMQKVNGGLGLINPALYSLAQDPSIYKKVYTPITFGYNIPWTASSGYNLVTGWGAPNIGELAYYGLGAVARNSLDVNVSISTSGSSKFELVPNQSFTVNAAVKSGRTTVTTGSFTASLETLQGSVANISLAYNSSSGLWTGSMTIPANASGLADVNVNGNSGSVPGTGFTEVFAGYAAQYFAPTADSPYDSQFGTPIAVNITTLSGSQVSSGKFSVTAWSYSIQTNSYTKVGTIPLTFGSSAFGTMWSGKMTGMHADGPMLLSVNDGAFGYLPFINGVGMQSSFIQPEVLAMPGAAAPGQSIFILAKLAAPLNFPFVTSTDTGLPVAVDLEDGSNVTASLVSHTGTTIASTQLYANSFLVTSSASPQISGLLPIPANTPAGLYDVILQSSFASANLGVTATGSFYGQIYVSSSQSVPHVSVTPSTVFEGQTVTINAKITYSNGTDVKYGMYSATILPKALESFYPTLSGNVYAPSANLWYDARTGLWSGNATLPSQYNLGGTSLNLDDLYTSGAFVVSVTGVSADGVPTTTATSAEGPIYVRPYLYLSDQHLTSLPQDSAIAFSNDVLGGPANLTGDMFLGSNAISGGAVTIEDSVINGTLDISNAHLNLIGVVGGNIVAHNSTVDLKETSLGELSLDHSQVSMNASSLAGITPALPTITIQSPSAAQNYDAAIPVTFSISGNQTAHVTLLLDGRPLTTLQGNSTSYTYSLNSSSLPDGVHDLVVIASQKDGLSASNSVSFSTNYQQMNAQGSIGSLTTQLTSAYGSISAQSSQIQSQQAQIQSADDSVNSLNSQLSSTNSLVRTLTTEVFVLAVVAVIGLAVALLAIFVRRTRAPVPTTPPYP